MCSEHVCDLVEWGRRTNQQLVAVPLGRGRYGAFFIIYLAQSQQFASKLSSFDSSLACSLPRSPRLMSWVLGPLDKLKTQGVATEYSKNDVYTTHGANSSLRAKTQAPPGLSCLGFLLKLLVVSSRAEMGAERVEYMVYMVRIATHTNTHTHTHTNTQSHRQTDRQA